MGLYIEVRVPKVKWYFGLLGEYRERLQEFADGLVEVAEQVISSQHARLEVVRVEVWREAPSKSEGGRLLKTLDSLHNSKPYFREDPYSTFIVSDLKLKVGNVEYLAYLRVNPMGPWRDVYGNIVLDTYDSDVADLFLSYTEIRNFFRSTVENLGKVYGKSVKAVTVGWGSECLEDIRYGIAIYKRQEQTLLNDILNTLKKTEPQERESLQPYNWKFLVPEIWNKRGFHERLERIAKNTRVKLEGKGSIILEGETKNSLENFYKQTVEEIIRPLLREMPSRTDILNALAKAMKLEKEKTLDEE